MKKIFGLALGFVAVVGATSFVAAEDVSENFLTTAIEITPLTQQQQDIADTLVQFVEQKIQEEGETARGKYVRVFKKLGSMEQYSNLSAIIANVLSRIETVESGFYLYGNESNALGYGYTTDGNSVYYLKDLMVGATADSFVVLKYGYSKDANDVFYQGKKIPFANPDSFQVLEYRAAKDNYRVFYHDEVIEEANASKFVIIDRDHAKDHNTVFYHKNPIKQY